MRLLSLLLSGVALAGVACSHSTTSPTTTSTTTTTTTATTTPVMTTETFSGTLGVGATTFYPFAVAQAGTVTATLVSIGGDEVPATVEVRLGIGTQDDVGCNATMTSIVSSKSPIVSTSEAAGSYCANITDVGNLFAAATFDVTITHP
jgi:hypothetical protein